MRSVSHEIKLTANTYVARGVEGRQGGGTEAEVWRGLQSIERDASQQQGGSVDKTGPSAFFTPNLSIPDH